MYTEEKKEPDLNEESFNKLKAVILEKAKEKWACERQYNRACEVSTMEELCNIIRENIYWCVTREVLSTHLIEEFRELFAANNIFSNCDLTHQDGLVLVDGDEKVSVDNNVMVCACGNACINAYGKATVYAFDKTTIEGHDNVEIFAYDETNVNVIHNAKVSAHRDAKVRASKNTLVFANDKATVFAYECARVNAYDNAVVSVYECARVDAYDNTMVYAYDLSTVYVNSGQVIVKAKGLATIISCGNIECNLIEHAIHRILNVNGDNKIVYASDKITFEKSSEYIPDESNNK